MLGFRCVSGVYLVVITSAKWCVMQEIVASAHVLGNELVHVANQVNIVER